VYGNRINDSLTEGATRFTRVPPAIDENYPVLQGNISPLHASKRSTEIYVQSYIDTYGLRAAVFRLTGMYGPRQFGGEDHGWVANFTIRTLAGLPIKVFGTDKQVRDILYVRDAASAFEAFYQHQKSGLYNIGGGEENSISIHECLEKIAKISGIDPVVTLEPHRFGDLYYFVSDITRAKESLGWAPTVRPDEGLSQLVTWVKSCLHLFRESVR
jgi:CDP-paratose 2-epimerase